MHLLKPFTGGGITADGQHCRSRCEESSWCQFAVLSRKIAAARFAALEAEAPAIFAEVSADVWRREWVSFCKRLRPW